MNITGDDHGAWPGTSGCRSRPSTSCPAGRVRLGGTAGGHRLAGLRIIWGIVRQRALNPFAMVMLMVFGLGLVLSFVTGDARFLLVRSRW